jgi:hypothetical protein
MVFRREGTYGLVAMMILVVGTMMLFVAPAWAQSPKCRIVVGERETAGPLAGLDVERKTDKGPKNCVSDGDILVVVVPNAFDTPENIESITIQDADGTQGTFFDDQNAQIETSDNGNIRIEVTDEPIIAEGATPEDPRDELTGNQFTVVTTTTENGGGGGGGNRTPRTPPPGLFDEDEDGIPDVFDENEDGDEEDEEDEDQDVSVTSDEDEDCIETDTDTDTNTANETNSDTLDGDFSEDSFEGDESASLERIDFELVAFHEDDSDDPFETDDTNNDDDADDNDTEDEDPEDDLDNGTLEECEDEGGVSATSDGDGATAETPGATARAGGDPDDQEPVTEVPDDVEDEIPTSGPLPNTDGFSLVFLALSTALSISGLMAFWAVVVRRARA